MSIIYGRPVTFGGGGDFRYILIAYCDTGTLITATKGEQSYTETSEGGTAVLMLPEGGIWTVYVGDSEDGEEVDFGDEMVVEFAPAEAAYTTPQDGVTYSDDISALTEEELNTIAKTISNTPAITNTTTDVYYSGSVGDYHLFTGLTNRSTRNWTYTGQSTPMPCEIVGFNHYDLSDAEGAYGEATATGKAGIVWMWKQTSPNTFQPTGEYVSETPSANTILGSCVSNKAKQVEINIGGTRPIYPPKQVSMAVFLPAVTELGTTAITNLQNLETSILAGFIGSTANNKAKTRFTTTNSVEYYVRDGFTDGTGAYWYVSTVGVVQYYNTAYNATCVGIFNI